MVLIIFAVAVVFVAWALVAGALPTWYRLESAPTRIDVPTADGWSVVAWHRPAVERRSSVPVVLCHGIANNHAILEFRGQESLAQALSNAGFDCYSVDLRGAGASQPPHEGPWDVTFDDHVERDLPAVVEAVRRHSGAEQVIWVGHSLGGLAGLAAASTTLKGQLAALVTIGSPVFFRHANRLRWLLWLGRALSFWGRFDLTLFRVFAPLAGRVPVGNLAAGSVNLGNLTTDAPRYLLAHVLAPVWRGVLTQLDDWIANDVFRSRDRRTDYRAGIAGLDMPVLVIGGSVDQLAPPDVVRAQYDLLTVPSRQLALFGKAHGHEGDYGHGDLLVGRNASRELYPVVLSFLRNWHTPS